MFILQAYIPLPQNSTKDKVIMSNSRYWFTHNSLKQKRLKSVMDIGKTEETALPQADSVSTDCKFITELINVTRLGQVGHKLSSCIWC